MASVDLTYELPDGQTVDLTVTGDYVPPVIGDGYLEPSYDGYLESYKIELEVLGFDGKKKFLDISEIIHSDILEDILEKAEEELNGEK